ncbi:TRAP transporter substrate-binding protein [Spirulina subsalsa FACHB-351]|uniref:TRAP transporter substrate-binding protein n=1 Tax=Spirulina subsalsa FACHB-351 TaxID=234711 RepID=A0ABT3L0F5_9CYAN|nr:TRAP transporter substrate-binding protein [Spirulina subsalsa]MCW6034967.1 TRAP transporter substrate-binding protein [Spirulina subsalsa FACHB-351]
MKRRQFVQSSAIAGTTAAALVACQANPSGSPSTDSTSLPQLQWRMATSWPQSLDTIYGSAEAFCQKISDMTGGRFTITPFAAGEIVGGLEVLDAVQSGAVECGHTAAYYYIGKSAALAFGTTVPFGLNAQQHNAWLYSGGGLEAMQKIYADFNIINFPAGNTGAQMGGWFKREVNTLSDLQGLKMRIPGLGGKVMERLGVNAQVLPGGEIFLALDRGTIDAAEWVGPYDDEKLGLHNAAQYYYYPSWWEPGAALEVQVNKTAWERLPKEYQAIFKAASYQVNLEMLARYDRLNQEALERLLAGGTQLRSFSPEIMAAAQRVAFEIYAETANSDATFKEVYEPWREFRDKILQWHKINELSLTNFVAETL